MEALVQHWLDLFILGPRCFLLIWREREVLYGKILQTHGLYTTGPLIGKIESLNHPPAIPLDLPGLRWVAALQRQQSMRHSHTFGHWDPSEPHNGRLANPWDSWSQEECKPPKRETTDQVRFKQLNHHRMPFFLIWAMIKTTGDYHNPLLDRRSLLIWAQLVPCHWFCSICSYYLDVTTQFIFRALGFDPCSPIHSSTLHINIQSMKKVVRD